jgi:hypothetical protein
VRLTVAPGVLETRNLDHVLPGPKGAHDDLGLDLEPVGPKVEGLDRALPDRHEPVAQLGEPAPEQQVGGEKQPPIAEVSEPRDVCAAAPVQPPRALDEVRAFGDRGHVPADLVWVHRAVRIDHHDGIAGRGFEPCPDGGAFPRPPFEHDGHVRPKGASDRHGVIG